MKNRKKQFLKIGIAVLVIAVAGIVAGVVRYRMDNRFDLTVGGHTISKDEYVNCMKSVEYDTKMQIQQDYDAVYEDGFCGKKYDGKYGYEILTENTVEQLKYVHAVYDLAEECGDVSDSSYEALEKRWKDENAKRSEKVENGEAEWGKQNSLGLSDNAVGYVDNDFFEATVPEELRAVMTESKEKIASGELKAKSYYDFANEDEYQKLLDSVAP